MNNYRDKIIALLNNEEFYRLSEVGGQKEHHQEGSAFVHSILVSYEAVRKWGEYSMMHLVALLHDVGKISHHEIDLNGDYSYRGHAEAGAEELHWFISPLEDDFPLIQWYVRNHAKPLYWRGKKLKRSEAFQKIKEGSSLEVTDEMFDNLCYLAICDIKGSKHANEADAEKDILYLKGLVGQRYTGDI